MRVKKEHTVWMIGPYQSLARELAEKAMDALKVDATDYRKRDETVRAIFPIINTAMDSAIESSVYALACESMARQIVDVVNDGERKRLTGRMLAEQQLRATFETKEQA